MGEVQRYISSSFWSDDWVDSLSRDGKLLYMYLLTNENTNIAGVYKITMKRMKDDTGISRDDVTELLSQFEQAKKAYYFNEYMILPKWPKHQKLGQRGTLLTGMISVLRGLPRDIKVFLCANPEHYYYDLSRVFQDYTQLVKGMAYQKKAIPHAEKSIPHANNGISHQENEEKPDIPSYDSDCDSDSDLDSEYTSSSGSSNTYLSDKPELEETTTTNSIKTHVKSSTGYVIDDKVALRFLESQIPDDWVTSDNSFFLFVKQTVAIKYPDKTESEKRTLFISAVSDWQNLREEYPAWLNKQESSSRKKAVDTARDEKPKSCIACGSTKLVGLTPDTISCKACGGFYEFDSKQNRYVFFPAPKDTQDTDSIVDSLRKKSGITRKLPDTF